MPGAPRLDVVKHLLPVNADLTLLRTARHTTAGLAPAMLLARAHDPLLMPLAMNTPNHVGVNLLAVRQELDDHAVRTSANVLEKVHSMSRSVNSDAFFFFLFFLVEPSGLVCVYSTYFGRLSVMDLR